ncbi:2-oxo acid dehydrogenase subunit E2 [Buchnera aphidicola]|uniref:2-oxo acid dehydrogenase subunit E2 n=1 Tax=Buchnera aphidicola TaxID=9 RepID=UPI0030EDA71A
MKFKIKVPDIGEDLLEIVEILVKENDFIEKNQPIIIIEGQKASMEIPSTQTGKINKIFVKIGDKVTTNSNILSLKKEKKVKVDNKDLKDSKEIISKNIKINSTKKIKKNIFNNSSFMYASPVVKRISRENFINLKEVTGSGKNNRIIVEDILKLITKKKLNFSNYKYLKSSIKNFYVNKKKIILKEKVKNSIVLSNIQKFSNKKFIKSWNTVPHITQFYEVDITDLENFRKNYNFNCKNKNFKISLLTFLILAVSKSLSKYPKFNSCLSKDQSEIILNKKINIGIAVNTELGILVPVLKSLKKKKILEISENLKILIKKVRTKTITTSEMSHGTFTISNLGNFKSSFFTPIINIPEVSILGISTSIVKPLWNKKKFLPRLVLPLSLSYDHRVINGVDGSLFMKYLGKCLNKFYKILF